MRLFDRIFGRRQASAEKTRGLTRPRTFAGAAVNRLTFSLAQSSGAVNADLDSALVILRSRARSLCANNEYGRRFLSLVANNVVGPRGPTLQVRRVDRNGNLDKPLNDTVETHYARWAKRCDVTGRLSLPGLLRIAIKAVARDGEALIRSVRGRQYPYGFALQLLESDRLDETINRVEPNGNVTRMGVEIDSAMRPVAYWILPSHPGENWQRNARKPERVPTADVLHLFNPERAEQVRGYTWLHAVLMRAAMLAGYEEAAIVAARVGAAKMGVFKRSVDAPVSDLENMAAAKDQATGALQFPAEAGEFIDLTSLPGVDLASWDPDYPHENFESFVKQCMRGWASGVDIAAHNLSGDMTDVNYSSARIAELGERDMWIAVQDWLINACVEPLYHEWLNIGLLTGAITFDKSGKAVPEVLWREIVNASRFQGRRWSWVDPLKEAQAARELIDACLSSRTEIAASQGREFEDIVEELSQERKQLKKAGLNPDAREPKPAPAKLEDNEDKTNDD